VTASGVGPAAVTVRDGRIFSVDPASGDIPGGARPTGDFASLDIGDRVLLPGLVDTHVHINEPGRTDWEGFESATRAAAAGGITTLVDMPLNSSPVTTCVSALEAKAAAAQGRCLVDYGFWGGVIPGNGDDLRPLLDAGVLGFKCFMVHSGIDEFPNVSEADLRPAMGVLAERGAVLLAHAEWPQAIKIMPAGTDPTSYAAYAASRPPEAEVQAIEILIRLCHQTGCRVHIVHLAAAEVLPLLARARQDGLPITVETCPHYLTFAAEEIADGATVFKCAPPIRGRENRERLWGGLRDGVIDLIVSDHSPCPPELKGTGDFTAAWGGISSLQLGLPIIWTQATPRGFGIADVARWMAAGPAVLAGLRGRKGAIAPGYDADLVVFDPDSSFTVDPAALHHRHKLTPYAGLTLGGVVETTFVRGARVYDRGRCAHEPGGRWIRRADAPHEART
jgi:allantoinase